MCVNCKTYGHDCDYEPVSETAKEAGRERHRRVKKQQQQRAKPQSHTQEDEGDEGDNAASPSPADRTRSSVQAPDHSLGCGDVERPQGWRSGESRSNETGAGVARILVSANGVSSYHGRTSALFEDNFQDRTNGGDHRPRMPDDWVERGLVAEAARQRTSPKATLGGLLIDCL